MTLATGPSEKPAVTSSQGSLTHGQLRGDVCGLRRRTPHGAPVVLRTTDPRLVAAALESLDGWASAVHLVVDGTGIGLPSHAVEIDDRVVDHSRPNGSDQARHDAVDTEWMVYTSGTTGEPKSISHRRAGLTRTAVRTNRTAELVWGMLYDPNRMAGLQVLVQALDSGAHVVVPRPDATLTERLDFLASHDVTAMSATPTMWRLILHQDHPGLALRQITLGGEIADQTTLDALAERFPNARIVHVFASTETGAAFSVVDGRAGFPAAYLEDPPRGIRLAIRDDVLHVHCPNTGAAGSDGFASTGDVVEIVDDRVLFRGRASGVVNVGGANVWPEQVEVALRSHPDVDDAMVTARPNPVSGQILVASIVPASNVDEVGLSKRVRRWARSRLPNTHVPAMIKVVHRLDVSPTGKTVR